MKIRMSLNAAASLLLVASISACGSGQDKIALQSAPRAPLVALPSPTATDNAVAAAAAAAAKAAAAAAAPVSLYYANCAAVRAAGAAPIRSGEPGYSTKLDRDGDGVGCE